MGKRRKRKGTRGRIKEKTLRGKGKIFFRHVSVESARGTDKDVFLICSGMKILSMRSPVYAHDITETRYAFLISDFLQADLENFGLKIGKPISNETSGYTYLVCS